jgi:BirA family transcriptional regulator, biotin operon repressor / biotin---[acetyl-CoA-carboxylase] ligase
MESVSELESRLASRLVTRHVGRPLHLFEQLGSTQDEARERARTGAPHGTLVWALEQTAGRGRMDRRWVSNRGAGLWFSLVLRPRGDSNAAALLSLAAGVGVARALPASSAGAVRLKWPNDVLLNGRKLAGILAEAETRDGHLSFVLLGVGLNLDPGPDGFPAVIADHAAALVEVADPPLDAAALMASLLTELEAASELALGDPTALRQAWMELSDTLGRQVRAQIGTASFEGRAVDLDLDGSLVLEMPDGTRERVRSGELIHLRPAARPGA